MDGAAIPMLASMLVLAVASLGSSDSQQATTSLRKTAIAAHNHIIAAQAAQIPAPAPTAPAIAAALLQSDNVAIHPSQQPAQSVAPTNRPHSHIQAQQKPLRTKLQSYRNSSNTRKWLSKH